MLYSKHVWQTVAPIIKRIEQHPFIQQLAAGTLPTEIFTYYLKQDQMYLEHYLQAFAYILAKIDKPFQEPFHRYIHSVIQFEQQNIHKTFGIDKKQNKQEVAPTTATVGYTNFLLSQCATQPANIGVAAVLPCFWVYQSIATGLKSISVTHNPYQAWIDLYSSTNFATSTMEAMSIFDQLAEQASPSARSTMQKVFYTATCWEWHFWNDAYYYSSIDQCDSTTSITHKD